MSDAMSPTTTTTAQRPDLLILGTDLPTATAIRGWLAERSEQPLQVRHARTARALDRRLAKQPPTLALVSGELDDADDAVRRLTAAGTGVIVLTDAADFEHAVQALRSGAGDVLTRPLDAGQLTASLDRVLRQADDANHAVQRVAKLERTCQQLQQSRRQISEQVDELCGDLVQAYQELAEQVQQATAGSGFEAAIQDELDLEALLRKTLEYLVDQTGPTNCAVYLPASADEYTLGGYVNYDVPEASAPMLLDEIGDTVAVAMTDCEHVVHCPDGAMLDQMLGQQAQHLPSDQLLAFSARHEDETLAVITMFRPADEPFDQALCEIFGSVAPLLGEALAKLIRIHHRAGIFEYDDVDPAGEFGDDGDDEGWHISDWTPESDEDDDGSLAA
jgi:ActR/RegA family two-component response regulator